MPMVLSKEIKPPDNETVLTRSGGSLIFAAYHLGKWFEVPRGNEIPEPKEWLQVPFNHAPDCNAALGFKKGEICNCQQEVK